MMLHLARSVMHQLFGMHPVKRAYLGDAPTSMRTYQFCFCLESLRAQRVCVGCHSPLALLSEWRLVPNNIACEDNQASKDPTNAIKSRQSANASRPSHASAPPPPPMLSAPSSSRHGATTWELCA